ncbi:MAG: phage late control D family protein [Lachnospiraceae bacterium]|nr:phage late control D family protein [Lachnospiraceae bacterium]MBR1875561.1 phage late control D family protein [Lachnospiraceae bacterium]
MADLKFDDLRKTYENFMDPKIKLIIGDKNVTDKDSPLAVTDMDVELTSGFEAGIATFRLVGAYDSDTKKFDISKCKDYIYLGSCVTISLGYATHVKRVFRGFIARVHFLIPRDSSEDIPSIEITAMDAKASMMSNRHSKRLKATNYSDAVKEILDANVFINTKDAKSKNYIKLVINDTPDKTSSQGQSGSSGSGASDVRVEMVEESEYEFIVKAAKKYNFEFFCTGKYMYFIEAKKNKDILIELEPYEGIYSLDVGYDITGLVRSVEVRNVESEKGEFIGKKEKLNSKISMGNKAKQMVEAQSLVYLDPSAVTKEEAGYRLSYLKNMVDYRLGSIEVEMVGIPELTPGRFIQLKNTGRPVNNSFYLTRVRHSFTRSGYVTQIEGCANVIGSD